MKKKLSVVINDASLQRNLEDILGSLYDLSFHSPSTRIIDFLNDEIEILLLDSDINDPDIFSLLQLVRRNFPKLPIIIISTVDDISLAKQCIREGASDFISKSLLEDRLKATIINVLHGDMENQITPFFKILEEIVWLQGGSRILRDFVVSLQEKILSAEDLWLIAEAGINVDEVARLIHDSSRYYRKEFVSIDLLSFCDEASEKYFWPLIKNILGQKENETGKNVCGTLYLKGFDVLSKDFQKSLLEFLSSNTQGYKKMRILISSLSTNLESSFVFLKIPALRERKGDLPLLLDAYFKLFSQKYNKSIQGISFSVLSIFTQYGFPGNYMELENIIKKAVLTSRTNFISLSDVMINAEMLFNISLSGHNRYLSLEDKKIDFEKKTLQFLLDSDNLDTSKLSFILDMPKSIINDRLKSLSLD